MTNVSISETTVTGTSNTGDLIGYTNNIFDIETAEDLKQVATFVNNGNLTRGVVYRLTQDIVLNEDIFTKSGDYFALETFEPIGNSTNAFKGTFDGNGKKISGLYLDKTKLDTLSKESTKIGLFGAIDGAKIKNLTLENCYVKGESYVSLLCGSSMKSTIEDITINNSVVLGDLYLSTVCAYTADTEINNCLVNNIEMEGEGYIGGLVAELYRKTELSQITNCSTSGNIIGKYNIGGIVGITQTPYLRYILEIKNCYNYINITTPGSTNGRTMECYRLGGIAGSIQKTIIENCKNNGRILQQLPSDTLCPFNDSVGGICGSARYGSLIQNCENNQDIIAHDNVGGICGETEDTPIINCVNNSKVEGRNYVGGIVGRSFEYDTKTEDIVEVVLCTNYGDVEGLYRVGGIAGEACDIQDSKCYGNIATIAGLNFSYDGDTQKYVITNNEISSFVGGIVGYVYKTVNNCEFNGKIQAVLSTKATSIGGIVGYSEGATIKNSCAKGSITANSNCVGGIAGYIIEGSKLENSYSVIDITITSDSNCAGGIVGQLDNATITNCFVMRDVEATICYGTIAGISNGGTITDCYYPNNLKAKAINGADDETNNCVSLDYSLFRSEDGLASILNSKVTPENGYYNWRAVNEYPELYVDIKYSKLYYDLDGGNGIFVDENNYLLGEKVELDFSVVPQKAKHEFLGYILNGDTTTIYTELNNVIELTQEINTLTAMWNKKMVSAVIVDDIEYNYLEGESRTINVETEFETDVVKYSTDGINYQTEKIEYQMPGEYTIFFKIEREDYFEYSSYAKLTIKKLNIDISNIAWQREWLITSLNSYQAEEILENKFTYNSYENEITLISARIPYEISEVKYYVNNKLVDSLICKNAGSYSITAVLEYDKTIYNEINNLVILNFEIEKKQVNKPIVDLENTSFEFIDNDVTLEITNSVEKDESSYTITNATNRYVGGYTAVCSLKDKDNFVWNDGTNLDLEFDYTITKKAVNLPTASKNTFEYDGNVHKLTFNAINNLFAVLNNKDQINVGKYEVIVYLVDTQNYEVKDQGTKTNFAFEMEITPLRVAKPTITNTTFDYDGKEKTLNVLDTDNYTVLNQKNTVAGTYRAIIALKDKINTIWSDDLNTQDITVEYTINKKKIEKPVIIGTYTYNGATQTANIEKSSSYSVLNDQRTNEGKQDISVTLVDKANTCWTDGTIEDLVLEFVIAPARMPIIESGDIKVSLENDEVKTNLESLVVNGAKITYSLTKDGEYTNKVMIEEDGTYTVYYKIQKENHQDIVGSIKVERYLDVENDSNVGTIILIIVLILLALGGGFVFYCYNAKILIFKPKTTQETVEKKLPFENVEITEKQQSSKGKRDDKNNDKKENKSLLKMLSHLSEDLKKAKENNKVNQSQQTNILEQKLQEMEDKKLQEQLQENVEEESQTQLDNQDQDVESESVMNNNEVENDEQQVEQDLQVETQTQVEEETQVSEENREETEVEVENREDVKVEKTDTETKEDLDNAKTETQTSEENNKKGFKFGKKDKNKENIVSSKTVNIIPTFDDDDEI
ncbi:MAG: hypothetical protein IJW82_03190 [Clostridia bacterium]|nr:hypothetical protein [Clostridia bacterium]